LSAAAHTAASSGKRSARRTARSGLNSGEARVRRTLLEGGISVQLDLPDPLRGHAKDRGDRAQRHAIGAHGGDLDAPLQRGAELRWGAQGVRRPVRGANRASVGRTGGRSWLIGTRSARGIDVS